MSTEQTVLEKLEPLAEAEVNPDFVARIKRPSALSKPSRKERFVSALEERLFLGEFGLAVGGLIGLVLPGGISRPEAMVVTLVSALLSARVLTALMDRGSFLRVGPTLLAGAGSYFLTWVMVQLYYWVRYFKGFDAMSNPVEWIKVMWLTNPLLQLEVLLFSGGVAALFNFLVRERLAARPWLSGRLHGERGKKDWRFWAVLLGLFVLVSALSSPTQEERAKPSRVYRPLALRVHTLIYQEKKKELEKVLDHYPGALEWYLHDSRVTNAVETLDMARYLVEEHGITFEPPQSDFETALFDAVEAKNDPLAEYLLAHGADPNEGKYLPLVEAVKQRRPYAIHFLLEHGADPNASSSGDGTALEIADKMAADDIWLILQQER